LITEKVSNSVLMPHGGLDRQLQERLQTRQEPLEYLFTWLKPSTAYKSFQAASSGAWKEPHPEEIAKEMNMPVEKVREIMKYPRSLCRLKHL